MTANSPAPALSPPDSVDRVRVIRRSIRCFTFGLIGLVPLLGTGLACLALYLWKEVGKESGDPGRLAEVKRSCVYAFIVGFILLCYDQTALTLALGALECVVQGGLLWREFERTKPSEWNPARHLVYWGAALAYAGLTLTATIIMLNLDTALRRLGS